MILRWSAYSACLRTTTRKLLWARRQEVGHQFSRYGLRVKSFFLYWVNKSSQHPDLQWRERLDEIQHSQLERQDDRGPRNGFSVNNALSRQMKGAKASMFPGVHTQHAQEVCLGVSPQVFLQLMMFF